MWWNRGIYMCFLKIIKILAQKTTPVEDAARNERASLVNNKIDLFLTCETVTVFLVRYYVNHV
jgi:hypothetical protein